MPITSGSIEYERRLNLGNYEHKNVVARVSWTVEPDEDDEELAALAANEVVARVKSVLNWKPPVPDDMPVLATEIDLENKALQWIEKPGDDLAALAEETANIENKAAPNLAAQHPVAEITAGIPPVLKRHRRTKAEMEAARAAEVGPTLPPTLPELSEDLGSPTSEPGMPSFDPEPAPPAEVTDQDLLDACQVKASSGKSVAGIKELVAKFSPGGLVQIPQDARRRFLDDLAKL